MDGSHLASRKNEFEAKEGCMRVARPAFIRLLELLAEFFVSMAPRANYALAKVGSFPSRATAKDVSCASRHKSDAAGAAPAARGDILSFEDDRDRRRKAEHSVEGDAFVRPGKKRKRRSESSEVGQALRSIYDTTVGEPIPSEMLDLLGKLG